MNYSPWSPKNIEACQNQTGLAFITSNDIISQLSKDFGNLLEGAPVGVVYPQTTEDISSLLKFAGENNLAFTVRSGGYSQGGQTLAPKGAIALDCSQMTDVHIPDLEGRTLTCQPAATWQQVVATLAPYGFLPKVMPYFPGLTVGGVLSVGGIGGNSHIYGSVSGNARELEVVAGSASVKTCNAQKESDLFEATLCGLGRCGVITKATIELRPFKPRVMTYYLIYTDHKEWLKDMETLQNDSACDYMDAFCMPSLQGLHKQEDIWAPIPFWLYNLQISFEYDEKEDLKYQKKILDSLKHWRLLHSESSDTLDFVGRYGARAKNMKASGIWNQAHPWFECMLSFDQLSEHLPELLKRLPLLLGDGLGYRLFVVGDKGPSSFMRPPGSSGYIGFAALPSTLPEQNRKQILDSLDNIHQWLTSLGGKRCLAGWLGSNPTTFWKDHYGPYYPKWRDFKNKYDPHGVLQSVLLQSAT